MESLLLNLEKPQKEALRKRASQKGSSIAAEIRQAITLYLNGASETDVQLLDILSKKAQEDIAAMESCLSRTIRKVDRSFAEIERLRGKAAR